MGRCPYCQTVITELKAFSKMEAKQLAFLGKNSTNDEFLDYDASENVEESSTWTDYLCPNCEVVLFRDYGAQRPSSLHVDVMIRDFLAGRSNTVMKIPVEADLDYAARELLNHKSGEVVHHLSNAWVHADLQLRASMRECFEETLVRLGKLKVVRE